MLHSALKDCDVRAHAVAQKIGQNLCISNVTPITDRVQPGH
jgi:hypothetical protein